MTTSPKSSSRRQALKSIGAATIAFSGIGALTGLIGSCKSSNQRARNVVMICIDDLNDYVGHLGGYAGNANTPNLDALAASGRSYSNAHTCVPICMPSRASVMFGRSPLSTKIFGHGGAFQQPPPPASDFGRYKAMLANQNVATLPQLVKKYGAAGYTTLSMGKVFHSSEAQQWDIQAPYTELSDIYNAYPSDTGDFFSYGPMRQGEVHQDQLTADWASSILSKSQPTPLFMAIGLYQPHLPWRLPQWAFDLHPLDSVRVPEYRPEDLDDVPPLAKAMAREPLILGEQSNFDLVRAKGTQAHIVQAYLAAMSHSDHMVGQIIKSIDTGPNSEHTDIILWSDHGYHLGEKLHVRKATLWEESTRVPLIIRSPRTSPGETVSKAVSLIDIAPTVIHMTGGDPQAAVEAEQLDGASLFGDQPSPALSHWMGASSLRTERWRYTRYADKTEELYDHATDPGEYTNLAASSEHQQVLRELRMRL